MAKSLHRTLEAKLASMKDPPSDSESDEEQTETISAINTTGKGGKRKGHKKDVTSKLSDNDLEAKSQNQPSNVIFLGHLPVGFEDREITVFLNQFGNVNRCRVSRSTKTGRSRGYAFVEFADAEVAKIVAETMSGYFLLEKRLVCHVLPMEKVYENMFAKSKRIITKKDKQNMARTECNKRRSAEAMKEITAKLVKRDGVKRKRLEELGIEYDFPGYVASSAKSLVVKEGSQQKVSSKVTGGDNEKDGKKEHEVKTSESQKKKVTKSSSVPRSEEKQAKDDATTDKNIVEAVLETETKTVTKNNKRKHQTKTTKKAKAPKNT